MDNAPYPSSHIYSVRTLDRNTTQIDVIVSNSTTAISPIFQFHSTILMNFVTAHSVFCACPDLRLRELSVIDPFIIYSQPLQQSTLVALVKYAKRNIQYITCQQLHEERQRWKNHLRSTADELSMWISCPAHEKCIHNQEPPMPVVKWRLGGSVCAYMPTLASSSNIVISNKLRRSSYSSFCTCTIKNTTRPGVPGGPVYTNCVFTALLVDTH
ncbi:hypothetical protein EDD15DRAFT_1810754 [Pisolithus albus]|nr:hypothetical protein EDD15DRAFT_1810754 [Pisolithus albus]